ncbi:MAG: hypothetical protein ACLUD9_04475 [Anaerotignum faecicola]
MITISKIPDGKSWVDAIAQYRSKGMRTNFYAAAEEFLPQLQRLSELKFDGGCYLFHEKEKQIDLYFFLEQGRKAEQIPVFDKPVLLEQVGVTKAPPDLEEWEKWLCMLRAAKTAVSFRKECGKNRTRTFLCKRRRSGNNSRVDAAVL